jgi:putative hydrolase of the HAD superfamily
MAGIRAVFIDAVGTLIDAEPPAAAVYAQVGRRHGSRLSAAVIPARFAEAWAQEERIDRQEGLRTSEARELARWRAIVGQVLEDVSDPELCFEELYRHFGLPGAWRLNPEAHGVLEQLAGRGVRPGVASNYDRRLRSVIAGLLGQGRVSGLVISSEIGWRKPAAEFFAAMVQQAGVPPDQILYVGDDPVNDYEGARAAGLEAVLFDPEKRMASYYSHIARLAELPEYLSIR